MGGVAGTRRARLAAAGGDVGQAAQHGQGSVRTRVIGRRVQLHPPPVAGQGHADREDPRAQFLLETPAGMARRGRSGSSP